MITFQTIHYNKRACFGINLYELTTADGITLDFLVYCGCGMFYDDDGNEGMPAIEWIPVFVMQPFLNEGRILFTDNFYASPSLAEHLLDNNTHLCKTVRTNCRNYCSEITWVNLDKGQSVFFSNQQTILEFWHANIVHQKTKHRISKKLCTCHSTNIIYTSKNNKDRNCLMKLVIVRSYNQYMGGADCVDQQLNDIHILQKS